VYDSAESPNPHQGTLYTNGTVSYQYAKDGGAGNGASGGATGAAANYWQPASPQSAEYSGPPYTAVAADGVGTSYMYAAGAWQMEEPCDTPGKSPYFSISEKKQVFKT